MQRFRANTSQLHADGAIAYYANWLGGPTLAKVTNCRLANMAGDMRRTVYATGEPDTFFSIPATCRIAGHRVRGYLTMSEGNIIFRHTYY